MDNQSILKIAGDVYVGYNPGATLDTALCQVVKRYNSALETNYSLMEVREMTKDLNVISCQGLDNFLVVVFKRMSKAKESLQAA